VIIGGLDNVDARRWLNQMVHDMVDFDEERNPLVYCIYIDGGTEGLRGQARVIHPFKSSCYECTLDQVTQSEKYAECTIKNIPRQPEHCISYCFQMEWNEHFSRPVDKDSVEDITWIFEASKKRAAQFNIEGVTYKKTLGVVKNIIPAIASTNATISAACANETVKILTGMNSLLEGNSFASGEYGMNVHQSNIEKKPGCPICTLPKEHKVAA